MKFQANTGGRTLLALLAIAVIAMGQFVWAQNLGSAPASNVAVQGQTGAQPEGAFLNRHADRTDQLVDTIVTFQAQA